MPDRPSCWAESNPSTWKVRIATLSRGAWEKARRGGAASGIGALPITLVAEHRCYHNSFVLISLEADIQETFGH